MPDSPSREALAWAAAFVVYVALGYWTKGLVLNWIIAYSLALNRILYNAA